MLLWPFSSMKKKPATTSRRFFYSEKCDLFEKSLDVYQPVALIASSEASSENEGADLPFAKDPRILSSYEDLPLVILVVGSGWVGHRACVYSGTSWWNSAGPETVASLGCTCVCIRHRGAFCFIKPFADKVASVLGALMAFLIMVLPCWEHAVIIVGMISAVLIAWSIQGEGAATFDDMLNDVCEALQWVLENPDKLALLTANTTTSTSESALKANDLKSFRKESDISDETASTAALSSWSMADYNPSDHTNNKSRAATIHRPVIFGGYSSGGHVAATLLQTPELFAKYDLPAPDDWLQGVLFISGVLAVRPVVTPTDDDSSHSTVASSTAYKRQQHSPMWFINFGMNFVWGPEAQATIPSPLEQAAQHPENVPRLPHLLVGCRSELFGLNWFDAFFCSRAYAEQVQAVLEHDAAAISKDYSDSSDSSSERQQGPANGGLLGALQTMFSPIKQQETEVRSNGSIDESSTRQSKAPFVKYAEIESDHWNILGSDALREALRDDLPQLMA